ncbi:MAG TPA: hypothetical protein VHG08_04485 [Longimicrobium sp.]|nr:hypothetical protein [Longimicrobium sp.]
MLDLRAINQNRFSRAKRLWTIANVLRLMAFAVGAYAVFQGDPPLHLPPVLFAITVAAELFQWRSDVIKTRSEALLRKLDLSRSFGMEVSAADRRDIMSDLPGEVRKRFAGSEVPDEYFTSPEPPGPRKAVENLVESAWYTKQQASMMVVVCFVLISLVTLVALATLIVASNEVATVSTRTTISKVVIAWLLLIFSLGMFRHAWTYYKLAERSERSYTAGVHLLRGEITEADALKQWYEYQIGRASSPLLPDWLWRLKRDDLNDAWQRASGR